MIPPLKTEPSTLETQIVDGSMSRTGPSTLAAEHPGRSIDSATQIPHTVATADRQAGLTQSPAQPCRIVAAGDALEATEKLYERHYLVIKIVSSFFACLIKFLYL